MKAITHDHYGSPDALEFGDMEPPTPAKDQVLLRVQAAAVNPLDWHYLSGTPYLVRLSGGLRRPKQPVRGVDVAGVVEAVGAEVTGLAVGDAVFGVGHGTLAEYTVASPRSLAPRPTALEPLQAAAIPVAAVTALQGLDKANVSSGTSVLVNGAAGGVGTFAVQLAVARGADVTAVCSTRNVELVRSLGASTAIDYTTTDVVTEGQTYDVLFDNIGNWSLRDCRRLLSPHGVYVVVGGPKKGRILGPLKRMVAAKVAFIGRAQRVVIFTATVTTEQLTSLAELVVSGQVTPVVGGQYPLAGAIDALREIEGGHARGKLVVDVAGAH